MPIRFMQRRPRCCSEIGQEPPPVHVCCSAVASRGRRTSLMPIEPPQSPTANPAPWHVDPEWRDGLPDRQGCITLRQCLGHPARCAVSDPRQPVKQAPSRCRLAETCLNRRRRRVVASKLTPYAHVGVRKPLPRRHGPVPAGLAEPRHPAEGARRRCRRGPRLGDRGVCLGLLIAAGLTTVAVGLRSGFDRFGNGTGARALVGVGWFALTTLGFSSCRSRCA